VLELVQHAAPVGVESGGLLLFELAVASEEVLLGVEVLVQSALDFDCLTLSNILHVDCLVDVAAGREIVQSGRDRAVAALAAVLRNLLADFVEEVLPGFVCGRLALRRCSHDREATRMHTQKDFGFLGAHDLADRPGLKFTERHFGLRFRLEPAFVFVVVAVVAVEVDVVFVVALGLVAVFDHLPA